MALNHQQRQLLGISLGLAGLCWLVFAQVTTFSFINLDDNIYVSANPNLALGLTPAGVGWAVTTSRGNLWMPATWLSYLGDHQFWGSDPAGFHRTNLVLHLLNTLLLFWLLRRATGAIWRSALVAALFAVHPLHVESVAWVAERKDVLCGLFFLLTLHLHLLYRRHDRLVFYGATLLCFAVALMAKPMAVTLPVVILLLDWWLGTHWRTPSQRLAESLPFLALAAAVTLVTVRLASHATDLFIDPLPLPARLGRGVVFILNYLIKTVWPHRLMVNYPPRHLLYSVWTMVAALAGLAVITALAWRLRDRLRAFACGWAWYLVMLLPVIGITRGGYQMMSDRYTYLPSIGLFIMTAWGLASLTRCRFRLRWPVTAFSVAVILALTWTAHGQTKVWRNGETLFGHALALEANNYLAQMNLGVLLDDEGRSAEALPHLQKALALEPYYLHRFNLANCLLHLERYQEAIPLYRAVLVRKPDFPEAHNNLGICLASTGDLAGAEAQFRQAIALQDTYSGAHYNLGLILEMEGHADEAAAEFRRTLALDPQHAGAREKLQNSPQE